MSDKLDQLLHDAAREANEAVDFGAIKAKVLRRRRQRMLRAWGASVACFVCVATALLFWRFGAPSYYGAAKAPGGGQDNAAAQENERADLCKGLMAPEAAPAPEDSGDAEIQIPQANDDTSRSESDKLYTMDGGESSLRQMGTLELSEEEISQTLLAAEPQLVLTFLDSAEAPLVPPLGSLELVEAEGQDAVIVYHFREGRVLSLTQPGADVAVLLDYVYLLVEPA